MGWIIGFEDIGGNPVVMTEKQKNEFLEKSHMKKEEVIFADKTPAKVFVGADLIMNANKK